ncbi:hypothetical protein [Quadrisphaera setariae]|uniref:Uncharacterized protein n=1 Tax=Quadrisphaera setariae TaxID=2593304 RepID=A0A5C8Z0B6_9ACTN|nr:hypothetical protein [Quadrisphaera setariae]TXR51565.1 hypothetical protein FMM08_22435 [Quadrisphaera setariae]
MEPFSNVTSSRWVCSHASTRATVAREYPLASTSAGHVGAAVESARAVNASTSATSSTVRARSARSPATAGWARTVRSHPGARSTRAPQRAATSR